MWCTPPQGQVGVVTTSITGLPSHGVAIFKDPPAHAAAFCLRLQHELLQYSYGSVRFDNIDVSSVLWDQAKLCELFDILRAAGASSQRIKAYRCGATDAIVWSMCEWMMCTEASKVPQEIHLSHNELNTVSLEAVLTVLEVKQMEHQHSWPCWVRIEGNRVSPDFVSSLGKDGSACLAEGKCNTRFCELLKQPGQLPRLVHLRFATNQNPPRHPVSPEAPSFPSLSSSSAKQDRQEAKSALMELLVSLKAKASQFRARDASTDPEGYDRAALDVRQARQNVAEAAKSSREGSRQEWQVQCQQRQWDMQQQRYQQYQEAAMQQQMLQAQQMQAQQQQMQAQMQAQQLQFQQMQTQQWQYQVHAQAASQQPASQDPASEASKAADVARKPGEGDAKEEPKQAATAEDKELGRTLNKARAQAAAQEIEKALAKAAEREGGAKPPNEEPTVCSEEVKAPKEEPPPLPQDAAPPPPKEPPKESGSTAVSSKREGGEESARSETAVDRPETQGSGATHGAPRKRYSPPARRRRRRVSSSPRRRTRRRRGRRKASSSSSTSPKTQPKGKAKPKSSSSDSSAAGKAKAQPKVKSSSSDSPLAGKMLAAKSAAKPKTQSCEEEESGTMLSAKSAAKPKPPSEEERSGAMLAPKSAPKPKTASWFAGKMLAPKSKPRMVIKQVGSGQSSSDPPPETSELTEEQQIQLLRKQQDAELARIEASAAALLDALM